MARDYDHSGLGRARARGLCAAALIAASLTACTSTPPAPPVGPWGYEFEMGQFTDQRTDKEAILKASTPFTVDNFMTAWRNSVQRDLFANEKAFLDLTLNQYETTSSGNSYAVSMDVTMRARDQYGRQLALMNGTCNAVRRVTNAVWGDFWQQARDDGSTYPLTATARNATMWQKVMDSCVAELAKQFDTTLAQEAPKVRVR